MTHDPVLRPRGRAVAWGGRTFDWQIGSDADRRIALARDRQARAIARPPVVHRLDVLPLPPQAGC